MTLVCSVTSKKARQLSASATLLVKPDFSTKFDEANQTIGALRFENNLLAEKTKKLEAKLFQVRAQLERISSAKLNEMLGLKKSASDRTDLGMISLFLVLLLLVLLFLFLLLIMLNLKIMM